MKLQSESQFYLEKQFRFRSQECAVARAGEFRAPLERAAVRSIIAGITLAAFLGAPE